MDPQHVTHSEAARPAFSIERIAAAVNLQPEGDDAAVLATALARATGGELLLITVEPDLPLLIPGLDWRRYRRETETMLASTRASYAPDARRAIDADLSIGRGITRILEREHRQLVVCGSSTRGPAGVVTLGHTTRQLIDRVDCALALAPRGLSATDEVPLRQIGVGYDGGPESQAALKWAAAIAAGSGAELIVRGVVDDRMPALGWSGLWFDSLRDSWREVIDGEIEAMRKLLETAVADLQAPAAVQLERDRPAESLCALSEEVDLLVVGSRRWGPLARLLLGGTGEALVHRAQCPLLVVPRQHTDG